MLTQYLFHLPPLIVCCSTSTLGFVCVCLPQHVADSVFFIGILQLWQSLSLLPLLHPEKDLVEKYLMGNPEGLRYRAIRRNCGGLSRACHLQLSIQTQTVHVPLLWSHAFDTSWYVHICFQRILYYKRRLI